MLPMPVLHEATLTDHNMAEGRLHWMTQKQPEGYQACLIVAHMGVIQALAGLSYAA